MQEFHIALHSLQQVKEFVSLAMVQPFEVMVGNEHQSINGKDLMGMFCLDFSAPLSVQMRCSAEEYNQFRSCAEAFVI